MPVSPFHLSLSTETARRSCRNIDFFRKRPRILSAFARTVANIVMGYANCLRVGRRKYYTELLGGILESRASLQERPEVYVYPLRGADKLPG
jgi:hypothetical protein